MDAPLIVALGEVVPLPDEVQGLLAVHVVDALFIGVVGDIGLEVVVRVHVNAAQGVNDALKSGEVDLKVVVQLYVVEHFQSFDTLLNAPAPGVGELVRDSA